MALTAKALYGDVSTDLTLVAEILDLIPQEKFTNPSLRWLDPACGHGNFMIILAQRLFHSLEEIIPDPILRRKHINKNMLVMVEINEERIPHLEKLFPDGNIICDDFLSYKSDIPFDIIIGNPPFNHRGFKKTPTNVTQDKRKDGETIWPAFVKHALSLLREGGYLSMITPSIWMKPDKAGIHELLTQYQIQKIRCFTNTQTNRLFHGNAQTPTCYFLIQKQSHEPILSIYETNLDRYIPYIHIQTMPLPVFGVSVFSKLQPYVLKVGNPVIIKTSTTPRGTILSTERNTDCSYCNIRTCILNKNQPILVYEYSNKPLAYHGEPKLILAHKMYGFPFYDKEGIYGISRRDNYVMIRLQPKHFLKWRDFLSTNFALYLFEGTRYRMKYLEKYVFQLIPDIIQLKDFPQIINDETIADYFQLTEVERKAIRDFPAKEYLRVAPQGVKRHSKKGTQIADQNIILT